MTIHEYVIKKVFKKSVPVMLRHNEYETFFEAIIQPQSFCQAMNGITK